MFIVVEMMDFITLNPEPVNGYHLRRILSEINFATAIN
jgi:hypothetical protein